ncbi:cation-independent mannose-6-phosphate receptor-like [Stegodyphus dumicola]|uniref:cation-independent mannose-6-phosphate receptor-like n=1 Tax=Stegodyphus dumicola TaxID=202533 RepID=UPI0015ABA9D9|nr:cation-independent mannose-6-phosphate receptor-like [Stegodyphus dumicola]
MRRTGRRTQYHLAYVDTTRNINNPNLVRPGGWPVSGPKINGTSTYYEISICNPFNYTSASLSEGCPQSSICEISGGKALSFANPIDPRYHYVILDNDDSDFTLYVTTDDLCDSKWGRIREAEIEFECGPNLGTPHFVLRSHCKVKFYWKTSVACINKPKSHQVPCYVIDHEGNVRDLSHLILKKGGYSVVVGYLENFDFTVNVCSEISGDEGCGSNSSACRVDWNNSLSFGKPHGRLQYTQEGLILSYLTDEIYSQLPKGCSLRPKTTIVFKCPPRHHSSRPALISNYNCQYKVEWYTEYACPQNLKGSLETCQFTTESHGVEIDLRPLKRKPFFNISSIFSGYSTFAISVCGGLKNFICSGKNRKSTSYPGQESCDNVRNQSTVIKFLCDSKASNNGDGQPIFISSESCIYTFEWRTKHACAKPSFESTVLKWRDYCSIYFKNKEINLKGLFLRKGEAWEATDQRNLVREHNAKYYVNVCGQVSYLGNLSSCGPGSSACVLGSNGKYLNIGNFTMPPIYDINSDSTRLTYIGGSLCKGGKRWKSTIDFFCRPGHINSKPILVYIDESECQYKFKWYTSEACPKGTLEVEGANCKVEADNLGINYDLTPLKHKVYEVDFESYRFYISICETYKPTCVITPMSAESIGNFQEKKINFSSWKIEISDLEYRNGIISSSFYLCHPFNKHAKIVFICDFSAGNGGPQFVKHDGSYIFHWHTNVVCSNSPIECMVQDSFSHLIYDLSLLSAYENSRVPVANKDNKEMGIYLSVCRPLAEPLLCDSKAAACMVENVGENEKAVISNLGQSSTLLVLEGPGHLILKYTNGNICTAYGKNVTYSTTIHFVCAEDEIGNNYLQYLNKVDACEYVFFFLWSTKAACPTGIVQSFESCQLTDPDSGFTFDLTPLWKANEPYTVKVDFNTTYQLNICGRVVSGCLSSGGKQQSKRVSVCRTDSKGKLIHNIAVSNSYFLSYSTGSDLSISYQPDGVYDREVIIKFPCNKTTADLNPKLISNDYRNDQLIFEMKTSLTCIPSHFDCNVIDEYGNEYDLNPLAKFRKINWEATDNRPSYSHLRYHINFCRPLNKVSAYTYMSCWLFRSLCN